MSRPAIPRQLERDVLVEAGHRCASPTCHQTTTEIAHIVPWEKVRKHTFDNLIALCANCHSRYDKGEIDLKSMLQYKANLSIINNRYGDFEKRVLMFFADRPDENEITLNLSKNNDILIKYLLDDGLLEFVRIHGGAHFDGGIDPDKIYRLTTKGRDFVNRWLSAKMLE
jgi:hypothetical protein